MKERADEERGMQEELLRHRQAALVLAFATTTTAVVKGSYPFARGVGMRYGTLKFYQMNVNRVQLKIDGVTCFLGEDDAEKARRLYREEVVDPADRAHRRKVEETEAARRAFVDTCASTVKTGVPVRRDVGGLRKKRLAVDQFTMDGAAREVSNGEADSVIQAEASRRFPNPEEPNVTSFDTWFRSKQGQYLMWFGRFMTSNGTVEIEIDGSEKRAFPHRGAVEELDRLAADGWWIVHVSEDKGVYDSGIARMESFTTEVRYLLARECDK